MIKNIFKRKIKKALAEVAIGIFKSLKFIVTNTEIKYNPRTKNYTLMAKIKKEW